MFSLSRTLSSRTLSVIPVLATVVLFGCPTEADPDPDPDPVTCEPLDIDGLAGGGAVPAGCWLVEQDWSIGEDVTVAGGSRFVVDPQVAIHVRSSGSLALDGNEAAPIVFEGSDPVPGSWTGIALEDAASSANTWSFVTIRHAGGANWTGASDSNGAVFADGSSRLTVTALTIEDAPDTGVHLYEDVRLALDGLTVLGSAIPARMGVQAAGGLSGDVTLDGDDPTIHIRYRNADQDVVLGPYAYTSEVGLDVTEAMTIEAGAVVRFEADVGLEVAGGSLNAVGTSDAPIVFEGVEGVAGFWKGLYFQGSLSTDNQLVHIEILHAGSSRWTGGQFSQGALYLRGNEVRLTMENSRVDLCEANALLIDGPDEADKIWIESTVFERCDEGPAVVADAVDSLAPDVVISSNDANHIRVLVGSLSGASTLDEDVVFTARSVPYYVDGTVYVYGSLHIEPSTTVMFANDVGLSAGSWPTPGGVMTIGEAGAPDVVLTGETAAAGSWKGIAFQGTALGNEVVNTRIEYAGSSGWTGGADSQAGLFAYDNSTVSLVNVTFADIENHDAFAEDTSVFSDCTGVSGTLLGSENALVCGN